MRQAVPALPLALALAALLAACGSQPERNDSTAEPTAAPAPAITPPATPAPSQTSALARISQFTSLKTCKLLESNADEGGWSLSRCPGAGRYDLLVSEGDLRENLLLETPGRTGIDKAQSLDLSRYTGGGFTHIGDTVEWRGAAGAPFRPDTLVIRYFVVETPDTPGKETAYLLAFAVRGGKPCLIDRVAPGPGQNDAVRRTVDGALRCKSP